MKYERKSPISEQHQQILLAIGTRIQVLRKKTGLSVERFCAKNDIPRISYANLEAGRNFHMTTLLKVLDAYPDIKSVNDFFKSV